MSQPCHAHHAASLACRTDIAPKGRAAEYGAISIGSAAHGGWGFDEGGEWRVLWMCGLGLGLGLGLVVKVIKV